MHITQMVIESRQELVYAVLAGPPPYLMYIYIGRPSAASSSAHIHAQNLTNVHIVPFRTEIASGSEVTWEGWMGHGTPAILFRATSDAVNQAESFREEYLTSGRYTLATVHCLRCGSELGWRYLAAHDKVRAV
jgi:hypothetical protein